MESLHLLSLAFSALVILWSDHLGFLYFIGKKKTLPSKQLKLAHKLVWVGLLGLIISGVFLVLPAWDYYLSDPVFITKMIFVVLLIFNGSLIGFLLPVASTTPFAELPTYKKALLGLSGGVSASGWIAATLIGFLWL